MCHIQFEIVHCPYINLIDSKYIISSLKAFGCRVATIHKNIDPRCDFNKLFL